MNMHTKEREIHRYKSKSWLPKGWRENQEYGISKYKSLCIKQIRGKDVLYSKGDYIQYLIITYNGNNLKKQIYKTE